MKLKRLRISMWLFLDMLKEGNDFIDVRVTKGIPSNCKFQYVIQTELANIFDMVIYHDSFPELNDGDPIPFIEVEFEQITRQ